MFGNSNKVKSARVETIIGRNTEIEGNVSFNGGLHIDGKIKGNVLAQDNTESVLILSKDGVIEGEVRVPIVLLNGEVNGDVYASNRVELLHNAKVNGNVYYNLLEMAIGAAINGNLVHRVKEEKRLLEYQEKRPHEHQKRSHQDRPRQADSTNPIGPRDA